MHFNLKSSIKKASYFITDSTTLFYTYKVKEKYVALNVLVLMY